MYDVCIIGAGPAGSTLARLIGDRYRVLLVDSRRIDKVGGVSAGEGPSPGASPEEWSPSAARSKLCGGLLAPKAQKELARQGLGVPRSVVLGPQLFAVRAVDLPNGLERLYQRFYTNVDRDAFDRWLASLVPSRVERAFGWTARGVEVGREAPLVTFGTAEGGRATVAARLVVGADGARSIVRRSLRLKRDLPPRYVAVQGVFDGSSSDAFYGAIFDDSLTDFYGWTVPKGDTTLVGAALPIAADAGARFDVFVNRIRGAGFRFGAELRRGSALVVRPAGASDICFGSVDVALLGEAAGLVSPSSAEGISYALRSGRLLAQALESGLEGAVARYRRMGFAIAADVLARTVKSSAVYGAATRRAIMASGVGAIHTTRRPSEAFEPAL